MSEWKPKSAVEVDENWMPSTAKIPVKAHARRPRVGAAVGGALGGLAGLSTGPAAPVTGPLAAGAGAVIGESLQRRLEGEPLEAGPVAREAGEQAAYDVLGGLGGRAVAAAGRPLMQAALKATPEVAQTAIAQGITATKEGARRILQKIGEAGQVTFGIARRATQEGLTFDQNAIARELYREMAAPIRGLPGDAAKRAQLKVISREFLAERGRPVTPAELHISKQRADALAEPLHIKASRGERLTDRESMELQWYKNFADKARELLEPIPGYKAANDQTRQLIEVNRALNPAARSGRSFTQRALEKGSLPAAGAVVGGTRGETGQERAINAAIGAGVGAGLQTPQALSYLALAAQNPSLQPIIANLLRGGRLLIPESE